MFYRISPETEYHSTGFNDIHYPNLLIESEQKQGPISLDVKYIDTEGNEHGPWTYAFDITKERFELSKDFILHQMGSWITVYYMIDPVVIKLDFDSEYADNVVKSVALGINNNTPDAMIPIKKGEPIEGALLPAKDIQYIMTYLIFNDGTSSDIRRTTLKSSAFD